MTYIAASNPLIPSPSPNEIRLEKDLAKAQAEAYQFQLNNTKLERVIAQMQVEKYDSSSAVRNDLEEKLEAQKGKNRKLIVEKANLEAQVEGMKGMWDDWTEQMKVWGQGGKDGRIIKEREDMMEDNGEEEGMENSNSSRQTIPASRKRTSTHHASASSSTNPIVLSESDDDDDEDNDDDDDDSLSTTSTAQESPSVSAKASRSAKPKSGRKIIRQATLPPTWGNKKASLREADAWVNYDEREPESNEEEEEEEEQEEEEEEVQRATCKRRKQDMGERGKGRKK